MSAPILITGAAQRLGLAIAQDILSHNQLKPIDNNKLIFTYRTKKASVDELKANGAIAIQADFSTNDGVQKFIDELKSHTSSLSCIIHNASDWDSEKTDSNYAYLFSKMMQIHASVPYQINLACKDMLVDNADIIHMTDYVQDKGSNKHIAYAASKAALHNLTLSFASLLAPKVKVNSIAPSLLMFNENDSPAYKEKAMSKSILGICPGPQEAVKAVNFIRQSQYLTGQVLHLNGGRHLK